MRLITISLFTVLLCVSLSVAFCPEKINWTQELVNQLATEQNLLPWQNSTLQSAFINNYSVTASNNGTHTVECLLCDTFEQSGCYVYLKGTKKSVLSTCTFCMEGLVVGESNNSEEIEEQTLLENETMTSEESQPSEELVVEPIHEVTIINNTKTTREIQYVDNSTHKTEVIENTPVINQTNINQTYIHKSVIGSIALSIISFGNSDVGLAIFSITAISIIGLTIRWLRKKKRREQ